MAEYSFLPGERIKQVKRTNILPSVIVHFGRDQEGCANVEDAARRIIISGIGNRGPVSKVRLLLIITEFAVSDGEFLRKWVERGFNGIRQFGIKGWAAKVHTGEIERILHCRKKVQAAAGEKGVERRRVCYLNVCTIRDVI